MRSSFRNIILFGSRRRFSPADLPGLAAWYDASDGATVLTSIGPDVPATDGQTVRRWLDKSGNGRNLDQETLANQPTLTGTGVDFSLVNANIANASSGLVVPYTVFIAFLCKQAGFLSCLIGHAGAIGSNASVFIRQNPGFELELNSLTPKSTVGAGVKAQAYYLTGSGGNAKINGVVSSGAISSNGTSLAALYVGSENLGLSRPWGGSVYEVITCTGDRSASLPQVEAYFRNKWGVA